ncbi:DUF4367 domain-containing protein [Evansella sp. AB-rgal1]|uniref:DUF4367 domain-containing protein n=1 Tax=Evansella sp. AB-rgal1 TaxID=3242696 RepID=UPI00359E5549
MNKHKDEFLNKLIDLYNNPPSPPLSKEEKWKEIQMKLNTKNRRSKKYFIVAGILLTIISFTFFAPKNASSFNWISNIYSQIQGTVTQITGSVGSLNSVDIKPPPSISIVEENKSTVKMDFVEAQQLTNFTIKHPDYLPKGFKLQDVTVEFNNGEISNIIFLDYFKDDVLMKIRQIYTPEQSGYSLGFDNEDTEMVEVMINTDYGKLLMFKDGTHILIWYNNNNQLMIESKINRDEIIKIAESM